MKAVENLKDYFSIVIKAAITPVKFIESCCGDTVSDKALVVGVIVGIMYPPSDFLGVSKPNGCQDQVIFHLRLALALLRSTSQAITIVIDRTSTTAGDHH